MQKSKGFAKLPCLFFFHWSEVIGSGYAISFHGRPQADNVIHLFFCTVFPLIFAPVVELLGLKVYVSPDLSVSPGFRVSFLLRLSEFAFRIPKRTNSCRLSSRRHQVVEIVRSQGNRNESCKSKAHCQNRSAGWCSHE